MGAEVAISLLFGLLDRAQAYAAVIQKAKSEGRDVTEAELDTLASADDAARHDLQREIAARRNAPGT